MRISLGTNLRKAEKKMVPVLSTLLIIILVAVVVILFLLMFTDVHIPTSVNGWEVLKPQVFCGLLN